MALNVLIVDDSRIVRAVVAKTLKIAGIQLDNLFEAGNGIEALKILESNNIDIVFADINMPEMNGIEMIQQMKEKKLLKSIPVVIISTERNITRIQQLKSMGICDYITKPFRPENIIAVVNKLLGESGDKIS